MARSLAPRASIPESPSPTPVTDDRRHAPEGADLRARSLRLLLPEVVHRLNNSLSIVQWVHDLGPEATPDERTYASEALRRLRDTLERLASCARAPDGLATPDLAAPLGTLALLLAPLASQRQVELELREGPLPAAAQGALEGVLLDFGVALLAGLRPDARARRRLRIAVRVSAGQTRVALAAVGLADGDALARLAAEARAHGWRLALRSGPRALAVRLGLGPRAGGAVAPEGRPPRAAPRVLLVHGAGVEREELAALLREHGARVLEAEATDAETAGADAQPGASAFELVLVEQRLAEPALIARLGLRYAPARLELLAPRPPPAAVLALLSPAGLRP
jgi:hypothetical protein